MEKAVCRKLTLSFVALFSVLLFSQVALAAQIRLAWDPNTEPDVAGYKIYYGRGSKAYIASVDVGKITSYRLTGLKKGETQYICITAYNTSGAESGYSTEVSGAATETTLPVSESPPTVTTTPTSEPTTSPETPPRQAQPPSSGATDRQSGGG